MYSAACTQRVVHVSEMVRSEMDVKHEQALTEKECRAAKVRERDKLAQACLEQYDEDQEVLRQIEAQEQKLHAQKL